MNEIELFNMFLYDLANAVEDTENLIDRPKIPLNTLFFVRNKKYIHFRSYWKKYPFSAFHEKDF